MKTWIASGILLWTSMALGASLDTSTAPYFELENGEKVYVEVTKDCSFDTVIKGNPKAARLSEREDQKVAVTKFENCGSDGNLDIVSTRYLYREGDFSYARCVLSVTPKKHDVTIKKFVLYDQRLFEGAKRIGYTDGSVIQRGNTLDGIEHPMSKSSVSSPVSAQWTPEDFKAGKQTIAVPEKMYGGNVTLAFTWESGPHRLDIEGLQLVDESGAVIAEDKHTGFAGSAKKNNTYTVNVPADTSKKFSLVCVYKQTKDTNSKGTISMAGDNGPALVSMDLTRNYTLPVGETWSVSFVTVTVPEPSQMRRAFQAYLERERAHPYRVFPHYNSWFDMCIFVYGNSDSSKRVTEELILKSMRSINEELFQKRGVNIESYLLDDGWDNWDSLWDYNAGFPNKFDKIYEEVKSQKSHISAWMSPWGGYNQAKTMRVKNAKRMGLETNAGGLSLATPKYYEAFKNRCMQMVHDYDMNMFKFDGIGAGPMATGAPDGIAKDLEGLLRLTRELREEKSDIFINCTVGTWASPFWLRYADCIWRGGSDHSLAGTGTKRERWITYRDQVIYERFASTSPLYPLNSLMNHGVIVSKCFAMPISDSPKDMIPYTNELWMGIACGTGLQEYYVSPDLMSAKWWDALADGIRWLRANETVLRDAHWVGGNPSKNEIYGYASWSDKVAPAKGILILRNPSDKPQTFTSTMSTVFELPIDASHTVSKVKHVYGASLNAEKLFTPESLSSELEVTLPPYEVLLFEVEFKKF